MSFDTSAFSDLMTTSLGAMTLEKLLTTILIPCTRTGLPRTILPAPSGAPS